MTLVGGNFVHEQWVGTSLSFSHFQIKAVQEGIKRAHAEGGTWQQVRRPLSWEMLRGTEGAAKEWGMGGSVACIGVALSYLVLLRASDLIADDEGRVHAV